MKLDDFILTCFCTEIYSYKSALMLPGELMDRMMSILEKETNSNDGKTDRDNQQGYQNYTLAHEWGLSIRLVLNG